MVRGHWLALKVITETDFREKGLRFGRVYVASMKLLRLLETGLLSLHFSILRHEFFQQFLKTFRRRAANISKAPLDQQPAWSSDSITANISTTIYSSSKIACGWLQHEMNITKKKSHANPAGERNDQIIEMSLPWFSNLDQWRKIIYTSHILNVRMADTPPVTYISSVNPIKTIPIRRAPWSLFKTFARLADRLRLVAKKIE